MRFVAFILLALVTLTGCMTLHADVPESVVRHHMAREAREDGVEIAALCSHAGQSYSEGAIACMAEKAMTCDASGRWISTGGC